jgi:enhancer of polycomb-like protein
MSMPMSNNGTPISVQAQLKKMQPLAGLPQMRISSNGGMRPPAQSIVASMQPLPPQQQPQPQNHSSPPRPSPTPTINGINGANRNGNASDNDETMAKPNPTAVNGTQNQMDASLIHIDGNAPRQLPSSPTKAQAQQQQHLVLPNGYHLTAMNGFTPFSNGSQYPHSLNGRHNGLSVQQLQNIKATFANSMSTGQDLNTLHTNGRLPASFIRHSPNG